MSKAEQAHLLEESKKRNFWGWGNADHHIPEAILEETKKNLKLILDIDQFEDIRPPTIEQLDLRAPRFHIPTHLEHFCSNDVFERARHCYGKSFRDIWRGLNGVFDNPPDYIAFPRNEDDLQRLLAYASSEKIAVVPFGGGSSTVGGVEPTNSQAFQGVITVDMQRFDQVLEIDQQSRCAHIQAGVYGPALDRALKPHGVTLRHYPQSYEFSTVGGWIATRSGGHFATNYTHIDEFVQSVRMVTADGEVWDTRRLPGNGAGPSEERMLCGSEGTFGIITSAWLRLQAIPIYKSTYSVEYDTWDEGVEACRLLSQSGLFPTNCRLVHQFEALFNHLGNGEKTVLLLGFESHNHEVDDLMTQALRIAARCGGTWNEKQKTAANKPIVDAQANAWKASFLRAPYLRDYLVRLGLVVDTFETAITWDKFYTFHTNVMKATQQAIDQHCQSGFVTCRFTHIYPDGPAPYYTIFAKGRKGHQVEQWDNIKAIASQTIIDSGGTITHHHAVGRDHTPYYEQQHCKTFHKVLQRIKGTLDTRGIMNPGVLFSED